MNITAASFSKYLISTDQNKLLNDEAVYPFFYSTKYYNMYSMCLTSVFIFQNMHSSYAKIIAAVIAVIALTCLFTESEGTYRKPPFNGSIFGKRGSTSGNYNFG